MFGQIYRGKKVVITGHTGFKGSWLSLWLTELGAEVLCLALPAETQPNHWQLLGLVVQQHEIDIRDADAVHAAITAFQPEMVFHLAAQALVRPSYQTPLDTWSTNVMGTANVLEACRLIDSVQAIVVVTTDKCYLNKELDEGYRESHRLGGHDPYSASKAATELLASSYRDAFFDQQGILMATARAGNVIGGGDWSEDRLIPDVVRSIENKQILDIRSPNAVRPWQHVLESLSGYLVLGQQLLSQNKWAASAWNFGPEANGEDSVERVLNQFGSHWSDLQWQASQTDHPHETTVLRLNSDKARSQLGWQSLFNLEQSIAMTAQWYQVYLESGDIISSQQIEQYQAIAKTRSVSWALS